MNSLKELLPPELHNLEWYDNSTLGTIDRCNRKGYWKNVFTLPQAQAVVTVDPSQAPKEYKGIGEPSKPSAKYGTVMHRGLDVFYSKQNRNKTLQQKLIAATRAIGIKYHELFPDVEINPPQTKHSLDRAIDVMDMYAHFYEEQDQYYEFLDTEVVFINVIRNRSDENYFEPFIYIARADGVVKRLQFDDLCIWENKNVVQVEPELHKLVIGRQCEGYTWSGREFPNDYPLYGVIGNVLAVRAAEDDPSKLFFRKIIDVSIPRTERWRYETIRKVLRWRALCAEASQEPTVIAAMNIFDRTTEECNRYGLCSYYNLCLFGPNSVDLSAYSPNTWNPLYIDKGEDSE